MSWADAHVALRALVPPAGEPGDDGFGRRAALLRAAHGEVSAARWAETRWCIVRVPTPAYADYLGLTYEALTAEFVRGSVDDDGWSAWKALAASLDGAREVRIVGDDTDLRFSVEGRTWKLFDGRMNLPDGEIATAPVETTVEGHITFTDPLVFGGQRIERMRLDFHQGRVTHVDAGPSTGFVETIVATDDGAARVGEYGIGVNRHIQSWTQDLFFDEKIVGTTHIALGRAYPECGGVNQSAIHWDIVKDLRPGPIAGGGVVYIDGERHRRGCRAARHRARDATRPEAARQPDPSRRRHVRRARSRPAPPPACRRGARRRRWRSGARPRAARRRPGGDPAHPTKTSPAPWVSACSTGCGWTVTGLRQRPRPRRQRQP